jgi:hypothetical protein
MKESVIRHAGVPTIAQFAGAPGPAIVIDTDTGTQYWLAAGDVVTAAAGGGGGSGTTVETGIATIDFGSSPSVEASVTVSGQTGILTTSNVTLSIVARSTATNDTTAHSFASAALRLVSSTPSAGNGFTITAYCLIGYATGEFKIDWAWI